MTIENELARMMATRALERMEHTRLIFDKLSNDEVIDRMERAAKIMEKIPSGSLREVELASDVIMVLAQLDVMIHERVMDGQRR